MSGINLDFLKQKVGSCNCLTKTPEYKYHDRFCYYRLLCEKEVADGNDLTSNIRNKIQPISTFLDVCNKDHFSDMFKYRCFSEAKWSLEEVLKILEEIDNV